MQNLPAILALNGALALLVTMGAGLGLYHRIVRGGAPEDWHLLHAGGTSRAVLLIALAGAIGFADMAEANIVAAAWLVIYFVWSSILAMLLRALTGERGFGFSGPPVNRAIFLLYASGAAAVFPGAALLAAGFASRL